MFRLKILITIIITKNTKHLRIKSFERYCTKIINYIVGHYLGTIIEIINNYLLYYVDKMHTK